MIYMALRSLDTGKRIIAEGSVFPSAWLKQRSIEILQEQGKITPALLPPIFAMPPPWKQHAAKLKKAGISDAAEWMEADPELVANALSVSVGRARDMQAQLYQMFSDPRRRG